ncbi:hypothetical protein [Mycobacterium kubicae]|uniref:hypothetical protein n=1 Tax=Mycobacterium kubicae TaxID=120959 RepID=UPI000801F603|nr:hypothetical protein [Mycobacterium kubicae]OBF17313.1 hypothetical protein A5725_23290 [Mycobacterium kubicae]OBK47401.1 hypothetical protein A5657_24335 [Mycobacterium kubicae]QNI07347.1 hypothetical protein GAN17_14395 [Mycobacterium kubicae]
MDEYSDLNQQFRDSFEAADVTVDELWLRYFSLGGEVGRFELDAYLNGAIALPPIQHDMLAQAINERLDEIAPPRAPYSDDFHRAAGSNGSCEENF